MLVAEYDYATDIAVQRGEAFMQGIERGIERGIEQGIEQGEHKKALETAKAFKNMGIPMEKLTKATGLSIEEIEKL